MLARSRIFCIITLMVINGTLRGRALTVSIKPNCLTVSVETTGGAEVASFDYEGRLWTGMFDRVSYRRGLDGKLVAKWQVGRGERQRRWLVGEAALEIEDRARNLAAGLLEALRRGEASLEAPLPERGQRGLRQALAFDRPRSQADAGRYHQVYRPVGILPPDQYMAVVLQATEGCAFNTCTFCDFYRDRPFRIKTPEAFREHALAVKDFLGEGLSLRRTIFLGDANALIAPMPRLLPLMEAAHAVYDVEQLGGFYAFLDGFSGEKKSEHDYRRLAELGLKRVYIGLESGNADLLAFLKKPGKPQDALQAARTMKAAGVPVGVIVLLGAGGRKYARQHVRDTVRLLNEMRLDMDDILYFSELIESEGLPYTQAAYDAGLVPLTTEERLAQGEAIERQLRFSQAGGVPHISRYDIREFVY
jgi:radical SAM superfamily enzyme YgiQ (UPF0313 family)